MSYNVTVLDAKRRYVTAMMAPDRPAVITRAAVATNHQENVEWVSHARFTATVERERFLLQRITLHVDPEEKFIGVFLKHLFIRRPTKSALARSTRPSTDLGNGKWKCVGPMPYGNSIWTISLKVVGGSTCLTAFRLNQEQGLNSSARQSAFDNRVQINARWQSSESSAIARRQT